MSTEAVLKLLIALCITLEIRPEDLAKVFLEENIQEYYDAVLESVQQA